MPADHIARYFHPLPPSAPRAGAVALAGGSVSFSEVEVLGGGVAEILPVEAVRALWPEAGPVLDRLAAPRAALAGVTLDRPRIMGVVNVTPDSFSDGGVHRKTAAAVAHGLTLAEEGADFLDIGGESTRPGADPVSPAEEIDRVLPVIEGLVAAGCPAPLSIDTRNATVARAALAAGARVINDVSALTHDPQGMDVARDAEAVCLMHSPADPRTMQQNPVYNDVLLDVHDHLARRVAAAEIAGIDRARIVIDPGIGFGKTIAHNLALIRGLSLLHGLGCAIMLGVSRKGFIGRLGGEPRASRRAPGSIAAGLAGLDQGAHILRVHDVAETVQAVRVWRALRAEDGREKA